MNISADFAGTSPHVHRASIVRGLCLEAWLTHRTMTMVLLLVWLLGCSFHTLMNDSHFLYLFGSINFLIIASHCGGHLGHQGVEAFIFALPPTRSHHYVTQFAFEYLLLVTSLLVGFVIILVPLPIDHLLPERWMILIRGSGLNDPMLASQGEDTQFLTMLSGFSALFVIAFHIRLNANANCIFTSSPLVSAFCICGLIKFITEGSFSSPSWLFSLVLCLTASVAVFLGYRIYMRKDPACGIGHHRFWWAWVITQLAALIFITNI